MKKIGALTVALAAFLAAGVSAFQVEPEDFEAKARNTSGVSSENMERYQRFVRDYRKSVEGYEMEFEYNGEVMTIYCPYDGGMTQYEVSQKKPTLIKSTDTCDHEVAFELYANGKEFTFYQDNIPYLLAEDYCRWRYSGKGSLRYTWTLHSVMKRVRPQNR